MPTLDERIAQFEHMAQADPDNDMAHFSLGNAYLQAERYADAAASFQRCIAVNPEMSKAYQLAGQALIEAGSHDEAVSLLNTGYEVAASKGDLMPKNGMADLLKSIGHEPPALSDEAQQTAERLKESGAFICRRTGRPGTQLDAPPMRGPVGQWIHENIAAETWRDWIDQGTKVINELRLDFSRDEDQDVYDQHMFEFLDIDEQAQAEIDEIRQSQKQAAN